MVMFDSELDHLIKSALQTEAAVTSQQKQAAWERLRRAAAHQKPLPAPDTRLAVRLRAIGLGLGQFLHSFAIHEAAYERARRNRREIYWGTGAYSQYSFQLFDSLRINSLTVVL